MKQSMTFDPLPRMIPLRALDIILRVAGRLRSILSVRSRLKRSSIRFNPPTLVTDDTGLVLKGEIPPEEFHMDSESALAIVASCLQSSLSFSGFAVAEAWTSTRDVDATLPFTLVGLRSDRPLVADVNDEKVVVNLALARDFSPRHIVALRLCHEVAATERPQWTSSLSEDEVLSKLDGVTLRSAYAVPVVRLRPSSSPRKSDSSLLGVLLFFSSQVATVSDNPSPTFFL
jgi:hypothetical protein